MDLINLSLTDETTTAHSVDFAIILRRLATTEQGLASESAAERLVDFGPNALTPRQQRSALRRFALQFHNVLIYVLLTSALITLLLGHWVDTGVIVGVVLINAIVGFIQEGKAEKALAAIRCMLSARAMVLRDKRQKVIPAEQVVPGDIVVLQAGDRVPADLRLIRVKNLRVDEASLTGESLPIEKTMNAVPPNATLGDRTCMAYSGTLVTAGQGSGVVVATGERTEIGRISELLQTTERIETPLLRKMAEFGRWLSATILVVAVAVFAFGVWIRQYDMEEMFLAAVGLAVAAIPEGLPAIMTITLAIGVQRMARRKAIIRLLPAVEALGSVTVICSDKTGTLTRNEMTVQTVVTGGRVIDVTGVGYEPRGVFCCGKDVIDPGNDAALQQLLRGALLCNDASMRRAGDYWEIDGDPTEGALIVAATKAGFEHAIEQELSPRTDVIPFESGNCFMATLHHDHSGHAFIYLKGAPERLLDRCTLQRLDGDTAPVDPEYWRARIDELAARGQRVLAVAFRPFPWERRELLFNDVDSELVMLGLLGMVDPPREEAIRAVALCHAAGIRVKMITGDHAVTAGAIAAQLGIGNGKRVVTGKQLEQTSDEDLIEIVAHTDVYARVSPEHKLRLVKALQARGEVIAMTGDGVNDAPALKRADVGVAMGITGTEAAKEAADIVLADDNFASIANAVEEGRTVYNNLRKTILFMMPTNGGEAGTVIAAIAMGLALPILPVQILWVNMVTAVTLSLALVFEPAEPGTMERSPRPPRAPIFPIYFVWRTAFVSLILVAGTFGMFLWEQSRGESLEAARTVAVNTLVMFEAFYLLSARYLLAPSNPAAAFRENGWVWSMIALVAGLQLIYTYAPFMQTLFHGASIDADAWMRIVFVAAAVYLIVEGEKWLMRHWRKATRVVPTQKDRAYAQQ